MATVLRTCVQVTLGGTAHKVVLAALVDAEQLEGSLSLMADMQAQGMQPEAASCDSLVMLLLKAGQLQAACQVIMVRRLLTHLFCRLLHDSLTGPLTHSPTRLTTLPPAHPPTRLSLGLLNTWKIGRRAYKYSVYTYTYPNTP